MTDKTYNLSEFKPICGVYKITNTVTGRVYVGQSTNIFTRWHGHVTDLIRGKHSNPTILEDFQSNGLESFEVELLELCDKKALLDSEGQWAKQLHDEGYELYNLNDNRIYYICHGERRP